nr:putative transporter [Quercus suber]
MASTTRPCTGCRAGRICMEMSIRGYHPSSTSAIVSLAHTTEIDGLVCVCVQRVLRDHVSIPSDFRLTGCANPQSGLAVPCRLPPSAPAPGESALGDDHRLGHHCHHHPGLLQLRRHRHQSLSPRLRRSRGQSGFYLRHGYVVHQPRAALAPQLVLLHQRRRDHVRWADWICGRPHQVWSAAMDVRLSDLRSLEYRRRSVVVDRLAGRAIIRKIPDAEATRDRRRPGGKQSPGREEHGLQEISGAQIPNAAITSFTSLIIQGFGVGTLGTQYLQIPGGAVQFLALLGGGYICTRFPNMRCSTMITANTICIIGAALLVGLPVTNKWGRLVALWLCYFQGLGFSMSLTMVSSNIAGYTKKQLTAAILFTGYCVGNIIGTSIDESLLFMPELLTSSSRRSADVQVLRGPGLPFGLHCVSPQPSDVPIRRTLLTRFHISMLVGYATKLLMVVVLYVYMYSVNKRRDRDMLAQGTLSEDEEKAAIEQGMQDATELDNKGFRYAL